MSAVSDTPAALETAIKAALNAAPISIADAQIQWPNVVLQPAEGTPHAAVHHMPAPPFRETVGVGGLTRRNGITQVDLAYPLGQGLGAATASAAALCSALKSGTQLTSGSTTVTVEASGPGPSRTKDGNWAVLPVSIRWSTSTPD